MPPETTQTHDLQPAELAADLIRYETVSPVNDPAIFQHLQEVLADHGVDATIHERDGVCSLTATIGDGAPRICLNGHVDVVPVGDDWTVTDPFDPVVEDGKLYGRGAADMEGGLAAQLLAFCDLAQQDDRPGTVTLMVSGDEEIGSHDGTAPLVDELPAFDYAIIGEPTDLNIQVGARGLLWATVTVAGESAHASRPHLVHNIMEDVPQVIDRLNDLKLRHGTDDLLPDATAAVTSVNTASPYNSIPDAVEIGMDIRYTTGQSPETIEADIRQAIDDLAVDYSLTWTDHGDAFKLTDDRFKDIATAVVTDVTGTEPAHVTDGGISDGKFFARAGTPYIELGPRDQSTGHKPDEYCHVTDLDQLRDIYARITKKLLEEPTAPAQEQHQ